MTTEESHDGLSIEQVSRGEGGAYTDAVKATTFDNATSAQKKIVDALGITGEMITTAPSGWSHPVPSSPPPPATPGVTIGKITTSTGISFGPTPAEPEPKEPEVEYVQLPAKFPKKVLVAFIEGKDPLGTEPYWAAYLELDSVNVDFDNEFPDSAEMVLHLKLEKKYPQ